MSITLKHLGTGEVITLGERLVWTNEFARSPVAMEARWGTTGALMLHVAAKQAGWPITLDGVESEAWLPRATCQRLRAWADEPGAEFELTLRGQVRRVIFDASSGEAFAADPVWHIADSGQEPSLLYRPKFSFLEV